jgi:hypothetical protein
VAAIKRLVAGALETRSAGREVVPHEAQVQLSKNVRRNGSRIVTDLYTFVQSAFRPLCLAAPMDGSNSSQHSESNAGDGLQPALPPGLGDLAEAFFSSLGITEERYRAVKVALELDPKCNCAERKKWLNAVGAQLGVNGVVAKMAAWMDRGKN